MWEVNSCSYTAAIYLFIFFTLFVAIQTNVTVYKKIVLIWAVVTFVYGMQLWAQKLDNTIKQMFELKIL